jgi:hypothetical protein
MDTSTLQWFDVVANIATAGGLLLLIWQLRLSHDALQEQTRAIQVQTFLTIALEFQNSTALFQEHINNPDIDEADLSSDERRAIDRYFYFADMEYMLVKQRAVNEGAADLMLRGIKSSASKRCMVEHWKSTASKFTYTPGFREFYDQAIQDAQKKANSA